MGGWEGVDRVGGWVDLVGGGVDRVEVGGRVLTGSLVPRPYILILLE